jgi:molybdopterin-guanine dinucleotide biosynthesis protein B
MHVIGFCGYSGSGKTTLVEQLIVRLRLAGQRVSVVKHAHHEFDIDHEGKDSWRHRQAGAFEVVIASNRRLAKIREFPAIEEPTFDQLVAELVECDWVLVEGSSTRRCRRSRSGAPPPASRRNTRSIRS